MKNEVFEKIKAELFYLLIAFVIAVVIFEIAFYKENFINLLRIVLSLFWLFVLPGYFMMLYWQDKLEFMERFVIGIFLAAGIIGISSYYFGLIGLNVEYHSILLPSILILVCSLINLFTKI